MSNEQTAVDSAKGIMDVKPANVQMIPKSEAELAFAARDEIKNENRALKEKLEALEAIQEQKRLSEMTELEKLREENAQWKSKAEKADTLASVISQQVEALILEIPEEKRTLIPETMSPSEKLTYINSNKAFLLNNTVAVPNTFSGSPGVPKPSFDALTAEEKRFCKERGISEESFAKFKK